MIEDKGLGEPSRRRGIYLLPNLFTTTALFSGFYAIVASMRGDFDHAAIAIFIAMIMDTLDGRIARMTNTESDFGAQYDSLADMLSFGIAPALVVYNWGLSSLGKPGWVVAFFYTAATALRLARFNSSPLSSNKQYFYGLPCTAAAGFVAGMLWVSYDYGVPGHKLWLLAAAATLFAGAMMLSNIRYYSFKDIDLKGRVPFMTVLIVLLLFMFISIDPPVVLLWAFAGYAFSGPILGLKRLPAMWRKRKT